MRFPARTKALLTVALGAILVAAVQWLVGRVLDHLVEQWSTDPPGALLAAAEFYQMIELPTLPLINYGLGILTVLAVNYVANRRARGASDSASPAGTTPEHVAAMEAARAERLRLRKENQRLALENEREQLRQAAANKSLVNASATTEVTTGQNDTYSLAYSPELHHPRKDEHGNPWITIRLQVRTSKPVMGARPELLSVRRYEGSEWSDDKLMKMQLPLSWPGSGDRFDPSPDFSHEVGASGL